MKQIIAITDITRMSRGHVCVAGYAVDTADALECIRPITRTDQANPNPHESWLIAQSGRIELFTCVEIDLQRHTRDFPHSEDWQVDPSYRNVRGQLDEKQQLELLNRTCFASLDHLFGTEVHSEMTSRSDSDFPRHNWVTRGSGLRSLGTIKALSDNLKISWDPSDRSVRVMFQEESGRGYSLKVTDLRFHQARAQFEQLVESLRGQDVYLRVGAARESQPNGGCSLQITGIYLFPSQGSI